MKQIVKEDFENILEKNSLKVKIEKSEFIELVKGLQTAEVEKSIGDEKISLNDFVKNSEIYDVMSAPEAGSLNKSIVHEDMVIVDKVTLEKAQRVYANTYKNRKLGRVGQPIKGGKETEEKERPSGSTPKKTSEQIKHMRELRESTPRGEKKIDKNSTIREVRDRLFAEDSKEARDLDGSLFREEDQDKVISPETLKKVQKILGSDEAKGGDGDKEQSEEVLDEIRIQSTSDIKHFENVKKQSQEDLSRAMGNIDHPEENAKRILGLTTDIRNANHRIEESKSLKADMDSIFKGKGTISEKKEKALVQLKFYEDTAIKGLKGMDPMLFGGKLIEIKAKLDAVTSMREILKSVIA